MRVFYKGTQEYLSIQVIADVQLTSPVSFSFDRVSWLTASWTGAEGTERTARVMMDDSNLPNSGVYTVWVRFEDYPEVPLLNAGQITVFGEIVPEVWIQSGASIPAGSVVGQYVLDTSTGELYLIGA